MKTVRICHILITGDSQTGFMIFNYNVIVQKYNFTSNYFTTDKLHHQQKHIVAFRTPEIKNIPTASHVSSKKNQNN